MPAAGWRGGPNLRDLPAINDQRPGFHDPIRQHQLGARQHDHWRAAVARRAAPMAAASTPRAAGAMVNACILDAGTRRPISTRTGSNSKTAAGALIHPRRAQTRRASANNSGFLMFGDREETHVTRIAPSATPRLTDCGGRAAGRSAFLVRGPAGVTVFTFSRGPTPPR